MRAKESSIIQNKLQRVIDREVQKAVRKERKKYIHPIALIRYVSGVDFLSLLTIQMYDFVAMVRKTNYNIKAQHLFILQYLNKVDYASSYEIRYMLKQSVTLSPERTNYNPVISSGLVERKVISRGKRNQVVVYCITREGRQFVAKFANKDIVRNMLSHHKATTRQRQKVIYGCKARLAREHPEYNLVQK